MRHELYCYFKLVQAYIRGRTVHRFGFVLYLFGLALVYASTFLGIWVILAKFHSVKNWTFGQIAFIYILSLISYGIRNLFFIQFRHLGDMVKKGELDRVLVRPLNPFLYIMGNRFELGGLSHISLGIVLFILVKDQFGIRFDLINSLYLVLAIISATLVQSAITVIIGSMAFFLTETGGLDGLYNGLREFIWYPITLYNRIIQIILFVFIPLAFASFVPAGIFFTNPEYAILPKWVWKISLLVGVGLFTIAYRFWKYSLNQYQSTGN